ncbi:hypothetical protein A0128_14885 [Leptospira tipperaryensis]|uniref:Uncharacterized protein n=1 Tax=Leptospira tipperaryensis TaxID=2564040 RepID=A0A1D7UZL2_9LEPT|nr:hypothetical protein A0128_14885 [Leptospira tipperaryensis]
MEFPQCFDFQKMIWILSKTIPFLGVPTFIVSPKNLFSTKSSRIFRGKASLERGSVCIGVPTFKREAYFQ